MKIDGCESDHATLETIRKMAVQRVHEGEKPSVVLASYGLCRTTIYTWLRQAAGKGRGLRTLQARKATGRPRTLTPRQEQPVLRSINGKNPRQSWFDFGLWTRRIVAELIEQKFGVQLRVTAAGQFLAELGLTPQKPLRRA
jgi:transposase